MLTDDRLQDLCDEIATAAREQDGERIHQAIPRLGAAAAGATPEEAQAALTTLDGVLAELPLWIGGLLAMHVGEVAERAADPSVIVPTLVERSVEALEAAARFAEIFAGAYGEVPDANDPSQVDAVAARLSQAAPAEATELVAAWFAASWWLHPVLSVAQRKEIRQAMPHRDRLTAALAPREDDIDKAGWLLGLLRVLDDEPLVVLHRPSGRAFRFTVGGLADNIQLQTLLAALLVGDAGAGLPGEPPTSAEVGAATDGAPGTEAPGTAQFSLVDAYGKGIADEGVPADIPELSGVRVLVLDPPQGGTWSVGRPYPSMAPAVTLDGELPAAEAATWLEKI